MPELEHLACYMAYTAFATRAPLKANLQETGMWKVYTEIELPIVFTLDSMEKWAVIACDQFTSDQAYWDRVRKNAEGAVSTDNLILPEAELGTEKEARHTAEINATMKKYMEDGVFTVYPNSFVYVERTLENGSAREGRVGTADLEAYD